MDEHGDIPKKFALLIDDSEEDTFLFTYAAKLARDSIDVRTHLHAADQLQVLKKEASTPGVRLPELIFIDINMPSMNGMDFLIDLKSSEILNNIPAIMISTSGYRKDIEYCYHHGAGGYLLKPSGNEELVQKLRQVFDYWIDAVEAAH